MDWRREPSVEIFEPVNAFGLAGVDLLWKMLRLGPYLPHERGDQSSQIEPVYPLLVERADTRRQIDRSRDRCGAGDRAMRASFAEVLEDEVSTQAEADQHDLRKAAGGVFNNKRQICCFSAVVKAR